MERTKHTPAPWVISATNPYRINTSEEQLLLPVAEAYHHVDGDNPTYDEAKANARLIAAAPELLEALEQMVLLWEAVSSTGRKPFLNAVGYLAAREAIEKAKGEEQ
jgi:hypothetical protein